jgi:hypothetical protein
LRLNLSLMRKPLKPCLFFGKSNFRILVNIAIQ